MKEEKDILAIMVEAARNAISGYPHTQTITFQMRAALAALEAQGYAVVPVEPTEAMQEAKAQLLMAGRSPDDIWEVMLKARPSPLP
jgi:predicted CoA-binding protein